LLTWVVGKKQIASVLLASALVSLFLGQSTMAQVTQTQANNGGGSPNLCGTGQYSIFGICSNDFGVVFLILVGALVLLAIGVLIVHNSGRRHENPTVLLVPASPISPQATTGALAQPTASSTQSATDFKDCLTCGTRMTKATLFCPGCGRAQS
jgi:hypothetical protein